MSGGRFDYNQYRINDIVVEIKSEIDKQGRKVSQEDSEWMDSETYDKLPEEIELQFKRGIKFLEISSIYAQRIDWYLSGDDGQESFIKRLNDEIYEKDLENVWIKFLPNTKPKKYGRYLVKRKDGKIHSEIWNGSGWAYNGNTIIEYMIIKGL